MATASVGQRPEFQQRILRVTRNWQPEVRTTGCLLPARLLVHGLEGSGKTSFAAAAPSPLVLMGRGETGFQTLLASGQLPPTSHLPELQRWEHVLSVLEWLLATPGPWASLVIDSFSTLERMCCEHVCRKEFADDWGKNGFAGYMQGYEIATSEWRRLLAMLDRVREERGMMIVATCSSRLMTFKNPDGADFDRYTPALHPRIAELTQRWSDAILFLRFESLAAEIVAALSEHNGPDVQSRTTATQLTAGTPSAQPTAVAPSTQLTWRSQQRWLSTEHSAAWDAKSRYRLPANLSVANGMPAVWTVLQAAIPSSAARSDTIGQTVQNETSPSTLSTPAPHVRDSSVADSSGAVLAENVAATVGVAAQRTPTTPPEAGTLRPAAESHVTDNRGLFEELSEPPLVNNSGDRHRRTSRISR